MEEMYFGRGNQDMHEDYIDFINYVFGFNGTENDFVKELPKLYKKEYSPACNAYVAAENGKLKAAVGVFPSEIRVSGMTLKNVGVGNVAVHPYSRSKGYMKKLMHMAVEDMIKEQVDFSALGGLRQRYNYYSYEKAGVAYSFHVNKTNLRHAFGDTEAPFEVVEVKENDTASLDVIALLLASQKYYPVRKRSELNDILRTWRATPYLIRDKERTVGYFLRKDSVIHEILTVRNADFTDAVRTVVSFCGSADFTLPEFMPDYVEVLEKLAENTEIRAGEMFSVFCYRRVIQAFLKLKTSYTKLCDGELPVLIHGRAGEEALMIRVADGEAYVETTEETPLLELSHLEAMRFFFAPVCVKRNQLPEFAANWFPVPLWIYSVDCV